MIPARTPSPQSSPPELRASSNFLLESPFDEKLRTRRAAASPLQEGSRNSTRSFLQEKDLEWRRRPPRGGVD